MRKTVFSWDREGSFWRLYIRRPNMPMMDYTVLLEARDAEYFARAVLGAMPKMDTDAQLALDAG